jgi:formiminotetrahydrofolate cyclodeaminase
MKDNTASIWNLSLTKFHRRAANDRPNPAGASVAIVTAVLGASLISMALKISAKKNNSYPSFPRASRTLQVLMHKLSNYADADVRLFNNYLAVRRTVRQTSSRTTATIAPTILISEAAKSATTILLKAANDVVSVMRLAASVVHVTASVVISDMQGGSAILHGSVRALVAHIRNNIPELEFAIQTKFEERSSAIEAEANALWAAIESDFARLHIEPSNRRDD